MKNVDNVSPVYYVMRGSIYLVITAREALIWEYDDRKSSADMTVTSLSLSRSTTSRSRKRDIRVCYSLNPQTITKKTTFVGNRFSLELFAELINNK